MARGNKDIMSDTLRKQHLLWYKNAAFDIDEMLEEDFELSAADKRTLKAARKIFRSKFEQLRG